MLFRIAWLLAFVATPASGFVPMPTTRVAPIGRSVMVLGATSDGANILPAAAMDHPVFGRVARAANAAVTGPLVDGESSFWVRSPERHEFRASVRGLRFDHAPGDGRFEALWAAAGGGAGENRLYGDARLARICGGRRWDLLVHLFPASASPTVVQQPSGAQLLLKPLVGAVQTAVRKPDGRRTTVRQIHAAAPGAVTGNLGDFAKLHGGPVREFSGVGSAPCVLLEAILKAPVADALPPPLPLLELTPDLARAFCGAEAEYDAAASGAPAPVSAPDGSTWEPHYDEGQGAYYYMNSVTGEASWKPPGTSEAPAPVASEASAPVSATDGPTWEPHYDENGACFYINSVTGESSWQPPDASKIPAPVASEVPAPISAPDGSTWEPHFDEGQGAYYYINSVTGESSWLN